MMRKAAFWWSLLMLVCALGSALAQEISVVGQDMEAGIYTFTCDAVTEGYCLVAAFDGEEAYQAFADGVSILDGLKNEALYYHMLYQGDECKIKLEEGTILLVRYGEGTLTFVQAIPTPTPVVADEPLELILQSSKYTSGEKLMARLRHWAKQKGGMNAAIRSYESTMLAKGYTSVETKEILLRAQAGEEVHPFHRAKYSMYNMPAKENGLENDTIFTDGTIIEYIADGGKKNREYGLVIEQEDGNRWLVHCARKSNGELIGKLWGSKPEKHIFEGYEGKSVRVYGEYLGYSDKYDLPVINIVTYGGMVLWEDNTLLMTMTAEHNMSRFGRMADFAFLIGADKCITSTEHYYGR